MDRDRAELDAQMRFAAILPDFEEWVAWYRTESAGTLGDYGAPPGIVAYGEAPGQSVRCFPGNAAGRPAFVFIHGGYWRAFEAADYDFIVRTALAAGVPFYNVDYRLMPDVRMADCVEDVRAALTMITARHQAAGGTGLVVAGHSAGAHLAVCAARGMAVAEQPRLFPVSGLYDLAPVAGSFLQDELHLMDEEIDRFSPAVSGALPASSQHVIVGADETALFRSEAMAYRDRVAKTVPGEIPLTEIDGAHHMAIVADFGRPQSELARLVAAALLSP